MTFLILLLNIATVNSVFINNSEKLVEGFDDIHPLLGLKFERHVGPHTRVPNRLQMVEISPECFIDVLTVYTDLKARQMWAMKLADASSKLPSGVMDGTLIWSGDMDECMSVVSPYQNTTKRRILGKHCMIQFWLPFPGIKKSTPFPTLFGVCAPDTCSANDVLQLVNKTLLKIDIEVLKGDCYVEPEWDTAAIVSVSIIGVLVALVVCGTIADLIFQAIDTIEMRNPQGYKKIDEDVPPIIQNGKGILADIPGHEHFPANKAKSKIRLLFLSFSFLANSKKLFNTSTSAGELTAVNGLRVISMFWVILGHTYDFIIVFLDNVEPAHASMKRFTSQAIINATFSVDSFFFLSGLLVTYLCLKQLRRQSGKLNWPMFYFHRFWRLTPAYAFVLMIYTNLLYHLISSPLVYVMYQRPESLFAKPIEICKTYWWTNLIYINNIYPNWGSTSKTCMGWGWYLANDMQFYILSPIFIILLYKFWKIGVGLLSLLTISCLIIRGVLTDWYGYVSFGVIGTEHKGLYDGDDTAMYVKPYTRVAPYLVGMVLGYILYKTKCKVQINKIIVWLAWKAAMITGLAVVYGLYYYHHNGEPMTKGGVIMYSSLARFAWSVALAWVIFACATGHGGYINSILSFKIWAPLGRLTYCAYLIHPVIIYLFYLSQTKVFHFSDLTMVWLFAGNLVISYMGAFAVSMIVEAPMIGLEKLLFKR